MVLRDVIYADELSDELKKVLYTVDVDYYIAKTRKLSATDLIGELVSRYEEQIEDNENGMEVLRIEHMKLIEENVRTAKELENLKAENNRLAALSNRQEADLIVLRTKIRRFCEENC